MTYKRPPKALQQEWEKLLRAEGLGRIEDVAVKRTEGSRMRRVLQPDTGSQYTAEEIEGLYGMYAQLFWEGADTLSDEELAFCWLYGNGWTIPRISQLFGRTTKVLHGIKKRVTPLALEKFLGSKSE